MAKVKQSDLVLYYIQTYGSITQLDALRDLGVMRLALRISDLRKKGIPIKSDVVEVKNRFGEKCRIKSYSLQLKDEDNG